MSEAVEEKKEPMNLLVVSHPEDQMLTGRLLGHLKPLKEAGIIEIIHFGLIPVMEAQEGLSMAASRCNAALVLTSPNLVKSDAILGEPLDLLDVRRREEGLPVIRIALYPSPWQATPKLRALTRWDQEGQSISELNVGNGAQARVLSRIADEVERLANPEKQGTHDVNFEIPFQPTPLFGRDVELKQLDQDLADPNRTVTEIFAMGGMGKTAMVAKWLKELKQAAKGVKKVFAWSFNAPDNRNTQTKIGEFFAQALRFFGDEAPSVKNSETSAERLFALTQRPDTILVLDGLEAMQASPIQAGAVTAPDLHQFLSLYAQEDLRNQVGGLLVITSRQPITTLDTLPSSRHRKVTLKPLDETAGVDLLHALNVTLGPKEAFRQTVERWWGHPLSLILLGKLLAKNHNGEILQQDQVHDILEEPELGPQAIRMMTWYDDTFGGANTEEGNLLRITGLFNRPMEKEQFLMLTQGQSLFQPAPKLASPWFSPMAPLLESTGLLATQEDTRIPAWNAHPMLRLFFRRVLQAENPDLFRRVHELLFVYLKKNGPTNPGTLEEAQPLLHAIYHGCQAGAYGTANEVLTKQLVAGRTLFHQTQNTTKQMLETLAYFFPNGWRPPPDLRVEAGKTRQVLFLTVEFLKNQGRIHDALPIAKTILGADKKSNEPLSTFFSSMLSSMLTYLAGKPQEGLYFSQQATASLEPFQHPDHKGNSHSVSAHILTLLGDIETAAKEFQQADEMWNENTPETSDVHAHRFRHSHLRLEESLDTKTIALLQVYADTMLAWGQQQNTLPGAIPYTNQDTMRGHVLMSRALMATNHLSSARKHITQAKAYEHQTIFIDEAIESKILHAELLRRMGEQAQAHEVLSEAISTCQWSGIILYEVDARLVEANLLLDQEDVEGAQTSLKRAEKLIEETGYKLRLSQLWMIQARHAWHAGKPKEADKYLDWSTKRIQEIGQEGRMPEWEAIAKEIGEPSKATGSPLSQEDLIDLLYALVLTRRADPTLLQNPTVEALEKALEGANVTPNKAQELIPEEIKPKPNVLWRAWFQHTHKPVLDAMRGRLRSP